jgi:hypothetical protein
VISKTAWLLAAALLSQAGVGQAFAAEPLTCATNPSQAYSAAKSAADAGHLNLAFFGLDRVIRNSAKKKDPSEFLAAIGCLDQVQERNPLVDLPNYDRDLTQVAKRAKSGEAKATLAHYAYRSLLQRIGMGAASVKAARSLLPLVRTSPYFEAVTTGMGASARGEYRTAIPALRKAVALASDEKATFKAELILALARALYATGDDSGAIAQYESLYKIGAPMQDALIESAWAQLRSKNYVKAIGLSYELSTGKLSQFFAPEATSIRAIAFVENCRYSEARGVINRFDTEYQAVDRWLKSASKGDASIYETAIARAEGAVGAESVPERVWSMWASSDLFMTVQASIRAAFSEERTAPDWIGDQPQALRAGLVADLKKIPELRARGAARVEAHLEKLNEMMSDRIAREFERTRFVRIEANQGAGRDLVFRNANPGLAEVEKKVAKADRQAKSYDGKLDWGNVKAEDPKAELWIDEIGNFEAASLDRCKAKVEYKKKQAGK